MTDTTTRQSFTVTAPDGTAYEVDPRTAAICERITAEIRDTLRWAQTFEAGSRNREELSCQINAHKWTLGLVLVLDPQTASSLAMYAAANVYLTTVGGFTWDEIRSVL